ncbi:MAG: MarR family transcriptional regulator [Pseudomonadota bacterium]
MPHTNDQNALRLLQAADVFRARLAGEFGAVHGISVNEFMLLKHLAQAPLTRLPRVELARRMHVSASTVTRMTAPMEKIGLVGRAADARDARTSFVVLTQAGRGRLEEAEASFAKHADRVFEDRWTAEERAQFAALMQRLVQNAPGPLT